MMPESPSEKILTPFNLNFVGPTGSVADVISI